MKKVHWVIFFLLILLIHITAIALDGRQVEYITKPMILVSLALYFFSQTNQITADSKKWITGALAFSWAGDVLLLFQPNDEIFFLLGLCAFLIAHIFYIFFFHHIKKKEKVKSNIWPLLIVVIYYASLITLLFPHLGDMKIAVPVYGIVISFMLMLAMHMLFIKNTTSGIWMLTGALLFVISDSVLAINKFYQPVGSSGILIMLTYGLAQLFIVEGSIKYITSSYNDKFAGNPGNS